MAGGTTEGMVYILDTFTGEEKLKVKFPKGPISMLAFSMDGEKCAAVHGGRFVDLIHVSSQRHTHRSLESKSDICCISFSWNGDAVGIGAWDRSISLHGTSVQFQSTKSSEKFAKIGASLDDLKKQKKDPGKNLSEEDSETGASKEKERLEDDGCDEKLPKEEDAEEEDACMCFEHVAEDARLYANAPSEFCPAYPTLQNQRALRYVFQNAVLVPQNRWSTSVNEAEKIYLDPWLYNLKGAKQVEAEFTVKSISKRDCSSASSFIIDRTNIMQNANLGHEVGDNSSYVSAHDSAMKDDVQDHTGNDVDGRNDDGGMQADNSVNSDRKRSDDGSAESMDSDELLI